MKEFMKKAIVILVLVAMLINSQLLLIISNAVETIGNIIDESKVNSVYEINLEKYVNYSTDSGTGVLTQFNLKTGIEYGDAQEYKPLKATGIVLNLPKIEGEYPESIEIIGKSTKATNGNDTAKDFNYIYNKENGEMKIVALNNQDENGNIYSEKVDGARDEYTVICYYSSNCYSGEKTERKLEFAGSVQANIADDNDTKKRTEIKQDYTVTENISGLISTSVTANDIYNGYINSNNQNGTSYRTEYIENLGINVSSKELSDEVIINTEYGFINKEDEEIATNEIVYKSTRINKNEVISMLGEDGYLQILNENGDVLGEINKDTQVGENGVYEVTYENELSKVIIKTSKPVKVGTIIVESIKQIKESMIDVANNRIKITNNINCINNIQETDEGTGEIIKKEQKEIYNFSNDNVTEIKDSETRVELSVDKTEWTNNIQNDVTFTATLVANDFKYNLFKNPVIEIKLPTEVEKVILGDVSSLYDDNLNIKSAEVIDKDNCKVIRVELNGIQNEYISNSMINGANIIIPATIIIKKNIDSVDTAINMTYSNESGIINDYEKSGLESKQYSIKINSTNTNIMAVANIQDEVQGENVDVTNGLSIEVKAKVGGDTLNSGDTVYENEVIEYEVKITNKTESTINNIKVVGNVPDGTTYVTKDGSVVNPDRDETEDEIRNELYIKNSDKKQETFEIQSLSSGESIVKKYKVMVDDLGENSQGQISSVVNTYINNQEILSKTMEFISKDAKLSVGIYPYEYQSDIGVRYNWSFLIEVTNNTDENVENTIAEFKLAEELNFVYCTNDNYQINFDENTRILKISIGDLEKKAKVKFAVILSATNFSEGKYEYIIPVNAKVYAENTDIYRTDTEEVTAYYTSMSIVKESPTEGQKLKCFQEIEYTITVTNEGLLDEYITIIDNMPEFISAKRAEYESYNYNKDTEKYEKVTNIKDLTNKSSNQKNDFELSTVILQGESLKIKIFAEVEPTDKITEVENTAMVYGEWIKTKTSNVVKNIILPYGHEDPDVPVDPDDPNKPVDPDTPVDPDNPDNPDMKEEYSINGVVWVDENKDGKRDEDEELLSGITVKLFDANTNSIVTDKNNNPIKTNTDKNGKYEFKEIAKGKYLVLFEYDTKTYEITTYQKNGTSAYLNSDVIKKEVSIDGNTKEVGITDILTITNTNLKNVDMGLIKNPVFDFKLDKYVSKITVSNGSGTKEYEYNNSQLAKVEIPAKQINNTEIKIEYKIVVINEGEVEGYINEIVDYLPSELAFSSEENKGWNKNKEGNLTNTTLSTEKIKPGESKEVTLILTKRMTENSTGTIINAAEIGETTNTKNVLDIDSTEANKLEKEDDYSEAKVIISIKTGAIMYGLFILISLLVVALVMYIMKRKNINKKIIGLSILGIVGGFVIILFTTLSFMYVDGEEHVITESQLKEHVVDTDGNGSPDTWVSTDPATHPGAVYWCLNPGKHLGDGCDTYYYDDAGSGNLDRIGNSTEEQGSVQWYLNAIHVPYNGTLKAFVEEVFNNTGSPPKVNISGIDNSRTKIKEKTSSYTIIGPYTIYYTFENCSDIKLSLETCTINGSGIDGAYICDSEGTAIDTCNAGGEIYIRVPSTEVPSLQFTLKLQTEEVKTGAYLTIGAWKRKGCTLSKPTYQTLITVDSVDKRESGSDTEISDTKLTGNLKIVKKDSDSGSEISGAKFKITGPDNYSNEVTMSAGNITVENLLPGTYTITETGAPDGYTLNLQGNQTQTVEIKAGETSDSTFYNRKYGNILIKKVDEDTQNSYLEDLKFKDVGFKIYINDEGINKYIKIYTNGMPSNIEFTTNKDEAQEFKTNDNGEIKLENIPQAYTYYVEEVNLPSAMAQYYDVKGTVDSVKIANDGDTADKNINNKQKYVDIQGYVWEDIATSKTTTRDNLYANENNTKDKRIANIPVYLKKDGNIITQTTTNSNGEYFFAATGNGYRIVINELSRYIVEFEYNGLKYQSVLTNGQLQNSENSSKAAETEQNRSNLNNNYHNISGGNSKTSSGTQGKTGTNIDLKYTNGDSYNSKLVQNTLYRADSVNGSVSPTNSARMLADTGTAGYEIKWSEGVRRIRNINLGMYEREQPDMAIATDIDNIQLSINGYTHTYNYKQREDYIKNGVPDADINPGYDVAMDGFNVSVKNVRTGNYKDMTYTRAIYDSYIAYTKKYPDNENKLRVFVTYKLVVKNESSGLIERVSLRNYADEQYSRIESSKIDGGADITWTENGAVTWTEDGVTKKNKIWQTDLIDKDIKPGECMTIYLQYELSTDTVVKLANLKNNEELILNKTVTEIISYSTWKDGKVYGGIDKDSAPGNITYNTISTYEDDTDSAPDLKIKRKTSKEISGLVFEDDTDSNLMTGQVRKGNGTYEENTDKTVKDVDVQIIDYNNKNTIKLYSLDNSGNAIESDAQVYTDNNGEYSFVGLIPGEYYIQYIYGSYQDDDGNAKQTVIKSENSDIAVTTQDYKSTIVDDKKFKTLIENNIENENGYETIKADFDTKKDSNALWYWYQNSENFTNSSAVDYSEWRKMINEHLEEIDYSVKNTYDNKSDIEQDATNAKYYYMIANTGIMDFPIEDSRNQITGTDYSEGSRDYQIKFGIVERPRQSIQVNKEISHVRLTLANGQILVQGDPRNETINYVTYPEGGSLKIEVDNEIIEGATLDLSYEITVKNNSELDYNDINYYRYGKDYDTSKLVKIKLDSIVDYVDEKLSVTYDIGTEGSDFVYYNPSETTTNKWQLIKNISAEQSKLAGINIDKNVYSDIKNRSNIVVRNTNIEISPIDSEETKLYLTAKKLLTDINGNDQIFDNYTELIKVSNSVGRFYGEMSNNIWTLRTPGNFNITKLSNTDECDNSNYARNYKRNAKITIIPPTGGEQTLMYYIIGISCLVILTAGIILIKKKVLD